jgi:hypothetical protein
LINVHNLVGLRDRALIGVMVYSFTRVGAVIGMRVKNYYPQGKRWWFRLHEKGGKRHDVPAHHKAEQYMDAYITAAGIADDKNAPLFRTTRGKTGDLTRNPMTRVDVFRMIKRRAQDAGLSSTAVCCHTFRATGITAPSALRSKLRRRDLENGGTLEHAQQPFATSAGPVRRRLRAAGGSLWSAGEGFGLQAACPPEAPGRRRIPAHHQALRPNVRSNHARRDRADCDLTKTSALALDRNRRSRRSACPPRRWQNEWNAFQRSILPDRRKLVLHVLSLGGSPRSTQKITIPFEHSDAFQSGVLPYQR